MGNDLAVANPEELWDLDTVAKTLDEKRRAIYLNKLSETGNPMKAAKAAGFQNTAPIARAMANDPNFAKEVEIAIAAGSDAIESEAISRAMEGVEHDIYFKGEVCGQETKKSDALMDIVLKAAKPLKYSQRKDITTHHDINIGVAVIPMQAPSLEDWEKSSIEAHDRQKLLVDPSRVVIDAEFTEVGKPVEMKRS